MKVVVAHKFFQDGGWTGIGHLWNRASAREKRLDVIPFAMKGKAEKEASGNPYAEYYVSVRLLVACGIRGKAKAAFRSVYSLEAKRAFGALLDEATPTSFTCIIFIIRYRPRSSRPRNLVEFRWS